MRSSTARQCRKAAQKTAATSNTRTATSQPPAAARKLARIGQQLCTDPSCNARRAKQEVLSNATNVHQNETRKEGVTSSIRWREEGASQLSTRLSGSRSRFEEIDSMYRSFRASKSHGSCKSTLGACRFSDSRDKSEREDDAVVCVTLDDGYLDAVSNDEPVFPEFTVEFRPDCSLRPQSGKLPGGSATLGIGAVRAGRGDCSDRPIRCATTSLVVIVGLVFCAPAACIVGARRPYSWTSLFAAMSEGMDATLETWQSSLSSSLTSTPSKTAPKSTSLQPVFPNVASGPKLLELLSNAATRVCKTCLQCIARCSKLSMAITAQDDMADKMTMFESSRPQAGCPAANTASSRVAKAQEIDATVRNHARLATSPPLATGKHE
mmetsp:Transcript_2510/g.6316  ORF Transcript_2510/g.6316 Transcript_2510/m.6316 type:complete len:380 (+) Transcript_2510:178-1317(+)